MSISGMPIAMLSGVGMPASDQVELLSIANGSDFAELEGLGNVSDEKVLKSFENGFYKVLRKTRNQVINHPEIFAKIQNPMQLKEMLDQAIKYFHTSKRDQVFDKLSEIEEKLEREGLINLSGIYMEEGIDPEMEDYEDWTPVSGIPMGAVDNEDHYFDGENIYVERDGQVYMAGLGEVFGFFKKARKFFKKAKKKIKKVGGKITKGVKNGLKKAGKFLMRINPVTVAIRMALRAGIKMNVLHIANKLAYGYMSWEEAQREGFSRSEYNRLRSAKNKAYNAYKKLGGKNSAWEKAIKKGNRSNRKIERVKPKALYPEVARANKRLDQMKKSMLQRLKSRAVKGIGEPTSQPVATEEVDPAGLSETKAAGGLLKKIIGWFKGLFDKEARAARKAQRQANREQRRSDRDARQNGEQTNPDGTPTNSSFFDRLNEKKDTRGGQLINKFIDAGSDRLVDTIRGKQNSPGISPTYSNQSMQANPSSKGGKVGRWIKNNKLLAAGIGVAVIGATVFAIPASRRAITGKKKTNTNKKTLSGIKLK
jgi:hypothetical protein